MQVKFRFITLLILILTGIQPMFAQNYLCSGKNDLQKENLKGRVLLIHQYDYNAAMKFGELTKQDLTDERIIFYDKDGFIWKIIMPNDTCVYAYNGRKQLIEKRTKKNCTSYMYDNEGKLVEINEYEYKAKEIEIPGTFKYYYYYDKNDSELKFKTKYKYSPLEIQITRYDHNGDIDYRESISGNIKSVSNGWSSGKQFFNSNGQIVKETGLFFTNNPGLNIIEYSYNENGDMCQKKYAADEDSEVSWLVSNTYKYDEHGNWVELTTSGNVTQLESPKWIVREIIYAESEDDFNTIKALDNERVTQKNETYNYEEVTEKPQFRGEILDDFIKGWVMKELQQAVNNRVAAGESWIFFRSCKLQFTVDYQGIIKDISINDLFPHESQGYNVAWDLERSISELNRRYDESERTPGKMNGFPTNTICDFYIVRAGLSKTTAGEIIPNCEIIDSHKYKLYEEEKLRQQHVQDSLTQIAEQQFYAWLENVTREYVESNRGRSAVLYSLTGESVLLPWKLKTKDGNITSFFKKGHTFDFILNRKESLADITFEDMVRIPLKDSDIDCIMVFFTEDKKYALLFFEEWDDTSRYHCKLACLATQSGDNTDTKVFGFSSKCQKEIMEYYNNNAPKRNQYLY
jgi:YD repeat-containing protein